MEDGGIHVDSNVWDDVARLAAGENISSTRSLGAARQLIEQQERELAQVAGSPNRERSNTPESLARVWPDVDGGANGHAPVRMVPDQLSSARGAQRQVYARGGRFQESPSCQRTQKANTFSRAAPDDQRSQHSAVRQQLELERIKDELRAELRAELHETLRAELLDSQRSSLGVADIGSVVAHTRRSSGRHPSISRRHGGHGAPRPEHMEHAGAAAPGEALESAPEEAPATESAPAAALSMMDKLSVASNDINVHMENPLEVAKTVKQLNPITSRIQSTVDRFNEWNSRGSEHSEEEYPLERSMWSVTMLIGMPQLGDIASAYLVFLLVACVLMQGSIIAVLGASSMTSPDFNEGSVTALRSWRRNVAHHITNYDTLRGTSLTNTVCNLSTALSVSATIEDYYRRVSQYLESGQLIGTVMCVIALLAWYMTLGKEITSAYETTITLQTVPKGPLTIIKTEEDGSLIFTQLSPLRRWVRDFITVVRLTVAGFLTYQGTQYLVYTIAIDELLLNAVALEFVITLDELIFESLAPDHAKRTVERTRGFTLPKTRYKGMDWGAILSFTLVMAQLIWAYSYYLSPQLSILEGVKAAVCAGDRDFVFAIDGMGTVSWGYPPTVENPQQYPEYFLPWRVEEDEVLPNNNEIVIDAILVGRGREDCPLDLCYGTTFPGTPPVPLHASQRAACCVTAQLKAPSIEFGSFSVATKSTLSTQGTTNMWNPSCADLLDLQNRANNLIKNEMGRVLRRGVQSGTSPLNTTACGNACTDELPLCKEGRYEKVGDVLVFNRTNTGQFHCVDTLCADVAQYCHFSSEAGIRTRMLCPKTCGCDDPQSPLALSLSSSGCPERCDRTASYRKKMAELPCEDASDSSPVIRDFLRNMYTASVTWPQDWRLGGQNFGAIIQLYGCSYFQRTSPPVNITPSFLADYNSGVNLCVRGGSFFPFKAFSIFCPVSCGCRAGDIDCPDSCPVRTFIEGNATTRHVEYHNLEPNYILPPSRTDGYVAPPWMDSHLRQEIDSQLAPGSHIDGQLHQTGQWLPHTHTRDTRARTAPIVASAQQWLGDDGAGLLWYGWHMG